jgi:hypothetical protein
MTNSEFLSIPPIIERAGINTKIPKCTRIPEKATEIPYSVRPYLVGVRSNLDERGDGLDVTVRCCLGVAPQVDIDSTS